ncbi:VCBS repeat-containing protein [Lewinella sp. W8]|uniref:FG-GAP repeat domain-containing protein n=1 Tax=Lewinella sp. W8 TaxID=2528208 RepID=UPI0010672C8D|nr:VCBS repeat-containing protein [Lewinella sp. W8]MTB50954.1 RNA-binding protein [Lewinella sp. W8]
MKYTLPYFATALVAAFFLTACVEEPPRVFTRLDPAQTGVDFVNRTGESDSFNILTNEYIYNGGGVGIGDFDQDGRQDIFFSGNAVDNQLYLNRGDWQFEEVGQVAGIGGTGRWNGGVTIVDVNADGLDDIYVCASIRENPAERANQLYLNRGPGEDGVPRFEDVAPAYGIADTNHNTQAAWLDYDLDGDLDLFLLVNKMVNNKRPNDFSRKIVDGTGSRTDKLYRQDQVNGEIRFTEVGKETGILYQGFALGATICDLNRDGAPDIYVSNDYLSNDLAYLNTEREDGSRYFVDIAPTLMKHTSYSAMGNDVADLNNDGLPDILAVDMLPADNYRRKMMLPANNYTYLLNLERYGYQPQFVRNTLQVSQGSRPDTLTDLPLYSEVAMQAGLPATDWSWTPVVADFNLDGHKDVIITNGFPRDITDKDFGDYNSANSRYFAVDKMLAKIPSVKLANVAYRAVPNEDGIPRYDDVSELWGIDVTSFSNGAAYADLDNDGDLDYVVNNIDDPAHLYRNNQEGNQALVIRPAEGMKAAEYWGTEVRVMADGLPTQTYYWHPHRGYLSSHSPQIHAAAGQGDILLEVDWVGGAKRLYGPFMAGETISLSPEEGEEREDFARSRLPFVSPLETGIVHKERDYIDFNVQPMLLRKLSEQGPGVAVTDWNKDGYDDIYLSGSFDHRGRWLEGGPEGFREVESRFTEDPPVNSEELGCLFFDADGDGDDDLYIAAGSYEFPLAQGDYADRFFLNEGGRYAQVPAATEGIPPFSASCVRAADYDQDGDLDLFVGARVEPYAYPKPVQSRLLKNELVDGVPRFVPDELGGQVLAEVTNVCDALFTDYNDDGRPDLLLVGEWAAPKLFINQAAGWEDHSDRLFYDPVDSDPSLPHGWWNSLVAGDFDNDGDTDYVVGNYGENTILRPREDRPVTATLADFDNNGTLDFVPFTYFREPDGSYEAYPFFNRNDFAKQLTKIKAQHNTHKSFAAAPASNYLPPEGREAYQFRVDELRSVYLERTEDGLMMHPLPPAAQAFPVFGMLPLDLNDDAFLDLLVIGNDHGGETSQGHLNGGNGLLLLGQGNGYFEPVVPENSGFFVPGEGRSLVLASSPEGPRIVAAQNSGPLRVFLPTGSYVSLDSGSQLPGEAAQRKLERYLGSGYLGQSSQTIWARSGK